MPGVAVDSAALEAAGLPGRRHPQALLRRDALATLTDIRVVSEATDGDVTHVTVEYRAGDYPGTTTFEVERDGIDRPRPDLALRDEPARGDRPDRAAAR